MERARDDECRYCDQDRHGGWIYCRSCGRLLSRTEVITVRGEDSEREPDGAGHTTTRR